MSMIDDGRTADLKIEDRGWRINEQPSSILYPLSSTLSRLLVYACLITAAALFLLPLLWMISTAFKDSRLLYADPPVWLPWPPTLRNFREALALFDFLPHFRNSALVSVLSVLGVVLSSSLAGFAFALLPARGRGLLFGVLLGTLAVPSSITIIPSFLLFSKLGWVNSYLPLIVPRWCAEAFYVFLFRQFFRSLPREIFDCAALDGCSIGGQYWRIALPLAGPALATSAVFSFLTAWNDYQGPLIYLNQRALFTIPLALATFQNERYTQLQYMMPMALLALLPVLLLFLVAQRFIVEGIKVGGPRL
jgi:ABC-type glycerol-3-phosphate transport system permease component